jgi:hypothetical protein
MLAFWLPVLVSDAVDLRRAPDLAMIAVQGPRPSECLGANWTPGESGFWDRARASDVARYCLLLARGYARLEREPLRALEAAQLAERLAGRRAAVLSLMGRAALRLGRAEDAWAWLSAARQVDERAFAGPAALHDFARAASLRDASEQALLAYRDLVARVELVADPVTRQCIYIEAAAHALAHGKAGVDEALGYLGEAQRAGTSVGFADWTLALGALALDRDGQSERAQTLLARLGDRESLEQSVTQGAFPIPTLPTAERQNLRAFLLGRTDSTPAHGPAR